MGLKFAILFLALGLTSGCSVQKLKNTIDGMAYQCGAGYDPEKAYIKINDPAQNEAQMKLIVLADKDVAVTEKGCLERPQDRLFVTNPDRSAGIWVAPDSASKLKLEALGRVDLPAACNSVVHGNGSGFTLNFDLPATRPNRELQSLEVQLYPIGSGDAISVWEPRTLESANTFAFPKDQPILSGEYRLVALVADRVSTAQSKSECTLRLDDSNLYISPADKISNKRVYNGQEVLVVQPGYDLNFYVHEGFRDVKIEYCLKPLSIAHIKPVMDAGSFECLNPQDFLKTRSPSLNEGFWALSYRGQRGQVETAWQQAIFLVEKTCTGSFESVASLRGMNCTLIKGNLNLTDLNDENQRELDAIGRISGGLSIEKTAVRILNVLPNLNEVFGDIRISHNPDLVEVHGFSALTFVLGHLGVTDAPLKKLAAFQSLQVTGGGLYLMAVSELADIAPFKQLQTVGENVLFEGLSVKDLSFLSSLQKTKEMRLQAMSELKDLSGLDSLRVLKTLNIMECPGLGTLKGLSALASLDELKLSEVAVVDLSGLGSVKELKKISISDDDQFASFLNGTGSTKVSESLSLWGPHKLKDLSELDFPAEFSSLELNDGDFLSLKGLEKIERAGVLSLTRLPLLKSLEGLHHIIEVERLSLADSGVSDLAGLRSLERVKGNLRLTSNPWLTDLAGLGRLQEIEGELSLQDLGLSDLASLPQGLVVGADLDLRNNAKISSLEGLNRLAEIGGNLVVLFQPGLKSLKGLAGLTIKGSAEIGYMSSFDDWDDGFPELADIMPLTQVARIGGALRLSSPSCVPAEFLEAMTPKVFGPAPAITVHQPETCPEI